MHAQAMRGASAASHSSNQGRLPVAGPGGHHRAGQTVVNRHVGGVMQRRVSKVVWTSALVALMSDGACAGRSRRAAPPPRWRARSSIRRVRWFPARASRQRTTPPVRSSRPVSGANGAFTIPAVPPGTYTVTVELQGFKTAVLNDVTLNVAVTSTVKAVLELGEIDGDRGRGRQRPRSCRPRPRRWPRR